MQYSRQDYNSVTGSTFEQIGKRASLIAYDVTKFLIDFITSMIKMFLGK